MSRQTHATVSVRSKDNPLESWSSFSPFTMEVLGTELTSQVW